MNLEFETPRVPNFIRIVLPTAMTELPPVSIKDLTDHQLSLIADKWKEKLIDTAKKMRELNKG